MSHFIKALKLSEIPSGTMRSVVVMGKKIVIVNIDNKIFALDDTCTHENCSLGAEGFLDGSRITCGCHGAQYDINNGKVVTPPATQNLKNYKSKLDGLDILIEL